MKKIIILLLFITFVKGYSQGNIVTILDAETKKPIESVKVINFNDGVKYSNIDGEFYSNGTNTDSIKLERYGYQPLRTINNKISKVVFLEPEVFEIKEVVINQIPSILNSAFHSIEKNYPLFPYNENFNIRVILKKDEEINKYEEIDGKMGRKTLFGTKSIPFPKNNFTIQIDNLQKVAFKKNKIDYSALSLTDFFLKIGGLYISPKDVKFQVSSESSDGENTKISFEGKEEKSSTKGYYYINNSDFAIKEFYLSNYTPTAYTNIKDMKYRTLYFESNTFYQKAENSKYFVSKAKIKSTVEVVNKNQETFKYTCEYTLTTNNNFNNYSFKNNVSITDDIFEIKGQNSANTIIKNNNSVLDKELRIFLEKAKNNPKEYVIN